jgi:hypothetical protein
MSGKRGREASVGDSPSKAAGGSSKRATTMASPMAVDAPKAIDEDLHRRASAAPLRAAARPHARFWRAGAGGTRRAGVSLQTRR